MKISILKLFFIAALLLYSFDYQAQRPEGRPQNFILKGRVIEGATKDPMIGANVVIKTVTDSVLVNTVTGADGTFEISRPRIPSVID